MVKDWRNYGETNNGCKTETDLTGYSWDDIFSLHLFTEKMASFSSGVGFLTMIVTTNVSSLAGFISFPDDDCYYKCVIPDGILVGSSMCYIPMGPLEG